MMKNTPENRKAIDALIETARIKNTGYQIRMHEYNDYFSLSIRSPENTETAAYPEIFFEDDWYGKQEIGFEISTVGYGDHSLAQAYRAIRGLEIATDLVEALLTTAELYGLPTRR